MTRRQRLESQILIGIKKGDNCYPVSPLVPVGTIFEPFFGGFEDIGFRKRLLIPPKMDPEEAIIFYTMLQKHKNF